MCTVVFHVRSVEGFKNTAVITKSPQQHQTEEELCPVEDHEII